MRTAQKRNVSSGCLNRPYVKSGCLRSGGGLFLE